MLGNGRPRERTVIFSEDWPSWLGVLPSLDYEVTGVFCGTRAFDHKQWLTGQESAHW